MSERIVAFGPQHQLVGTLCTPVMARVQPVAFVLLNAGVISRIGPHRFNVKLARHLASLGISSLRFDLSGRGDSRAAAGAKSYEQQIQADLTAAMDHITASTGIERFVIAGICSGAYAGFAMAQHDARVCGLWMLDGHAYVTLRSRLARHWLQLTRSFGSTLYAWTSRSLRSLSNGPALATSTPGDTAGSSVLSPTRAQFAAALTQMVARGVKVYMVYSSDILWRYSYRRQFHDTFRGHDFVQSVRCDHLPHVNHTLTTLAAQREVIHLIGDWAVREVAPAQPPAPNLARSNT